MNILFLSAFSVVLVFYILIPGGGAFWVRRRWRVFRRKVVDATLLPEITYAKLKKAHEGVVGEFRMLGSLQAIQGDDTIWISSDTISLRVHLSRVDVYTLPHSSFSRNKNMLLSMKENLTDEVPVRLPWSRFFSLPEGTKLFIAGILFMENGQPYFRSTRENPLLVLIYDGAEDSILLRTIWAGRQKNEYINDFTPGSLAAGGLLLLLLTYLSFRHGGETFLSWLIFTMGVSPLLVLFPPGLAFFEGYRFLWGRGRRLRAERDLVCLPIRYWPDSVRIEDCSDITLPNGEMYGFREFATGRDALHEVRDGRVIVTCQNRKTSPLTIFCHTFGVLKPDNGGEGSDFIKSNDLLISPLIVPGNPIALHKICSRRARIMEILAGAAFITGLGINLSLFFFILLYFIN